MAINYTKATWVNGAPPALSAENINHMDDGIKQACDAIDSLNVAPPAHAASHKHSGSDEIATATPAANAIPKADASGKLDTWISDATTSAKGKVQLATSAELEAGTDTAKALTPAVVRPAVIKRTKMPDGATAVYSQDAWATTDLWSAVNVTLSMSNGYLIATPTGGTGSRIYRSGFSIPANNVIVIRGHRDASASASIMIEGLAADATTSTGFVIKNITGAQDQIVMLQLSAPTSYVRIYPDIYSGVNTLYIDYIFIGHYSYLLGSLTEEAALDANLISNTAAIGAYASGTITSNGTNVSDGNTVTIHGKVYTFKSTLTPTEGEVLIGADAQTSLANLAAAINRTDPGSYDGVIYKVAAAHPLVSASANSLTLTVTALQTGELGNQITLAKSAATLTLSGSTLTGGYSATANKLATLAAPIIAGNGTRPAAAQIELTNTAKIGYENTVDVASGGTVTLPSGGTWIWAVFGYGATINSAKQGSSAGGTTLTVSGANATVWYRRYA